MLIFGTKKEEIAQKALSKALLNLCMKTSIAFYAQILLRLPISFTDKTATACASKTRIYLNEQYFLSLVPKEREILLVHELLHIVLQHHDRKQTRNALLWNIACDYAVDILLVDYFGSIQDDYLLDMKYRDMSVEEIYKDLTENLPKQDKPKFEDIIDENNKEFKELFKDEEVNIKELITEVVTLMKGDKNVIGNLPNELQLYITETLKPVLPWQNILNRYFNNKVARQTNWKKRNRKYTSIYIPSKQSVSLSRVDFLIDTSGSISQEEFNYFISEISGVLKQYNPEVIGINQFDHEYKGTNLVKSLKDFKNIKFVGGGGTSLDDTFEAIKGFDTECFLIFTDGWLLIPNNPPNKDIIWLVYDNINFEAPYGKVIKWKRN